MTKSGTLVYRFELDGSGQQVKLWSAGLGTRTSWEQCAEEGKGWEHKRADDGKQQTLRKGEGWFRER